jgi:N-acetylneuraminic acid mutarotase
VSGTLPGVTVAATDSTASETAGNTGKFTLTRTGSTATALEVRYAITGTATNGTDYTLLDGDVVIPAGASSVTLTVSPTNDSLVEGTESVVLTVLGGTGYQVGSNSAAQVNIADNDSPAPAGNWPSSWSNAPDSTRTRWESSAVQMNGKLWVFGGWIASSSTGSQNVSYYDFATRTWTALKDPMPVPHTHSAHAADPANNAIYFLGGLFGNYPGVSTNRVWKFNTVTRAWTELPMMPTNRDSGAAALVNNELHYFGGTLPDRITNTGLHYVLDLNNLAAGWRTEAALPEARDHLAAVTLGGKIYAVGGEFGHDILHDQQSFVHRYDPVTNAWERVADLPTAKSHQESSTFVTPRGTIISAGGQVEDYKSTDDVVEYDPATNKWTVIGKLPMPLQGPAVAIYGNDVVVATGNAGQGPIDTTWWGTLK